MCISALDSPVRRSDGWGGRGDVFVVGDEAGVDKVCETFLNVAGALYWMIVKPRRAQGYVRWILLSVVLMAGAGVVTVFWSAMRTVFGKFLKLFSMTRAPYTD